MPYSTVPTVVRVSTICNPARSSAPHSFGQVAHRPVGVEQVKGLTGRDAPDDGVELLEARLVGQLRVGLDRHHTAASHDPGHLGEGLVDVGKEEHRRLTQHGVEALRFEGQLRHIALAPLDVGADARRHLEHGGIEIQPDDRSGAADPVGRRAGRDSGAAGDVEDSVTLANSRQIDHHRRPLREQRRNEQLLVRRRLLRGDLKCLGHGQPSV